MQINFNYFIYKLKVCYFGSLFLKHACLTSYQDVPMSDWQVIAGGRASGYNGLANVRFDERINTGGAHDSKRW